MTARTRERPRPGWYAADDLVETMPPVARWSLVAAAGVLAIAAAVVIAVLGEPPWRAVPAWVLAVSGGVIVQVSVDSHVTRSRWRVRKDVLVTGTVHDWLLPSLLGVSSLLHLLGVASGSDRGWLDWASVIGFAVLLGAGAGEVLAPRRVVPRIGAVPVRT